MIEVKVKYVFCSYRGILIVQDVQGNKIDHLCGKMTLEKYEEIERLSNDNTEFDGLGNYEQYASEVKNNVEADKDDVNNIPFWIPLNAQVSTSFTFTIENTSQKKESVVLFRANESIPTTNFGFSNGITIDKPNDYRKFLQQLIVNPIEIKQIKIINEDKIINGNVEIKKMSATGIPVIKKLTTDYKTFQHTQMQKNNISEYHLNFILDANTEFNFDLAGNSKIHIQLFN
jgi:hypothetical protein